MVGHEATINNIPQDATFAKWTGKRGKNGKKEDRNRYEGRSSGQHLKEKIKYLTENL